MRQVGRLFQPDETVSIAVGRLAIGLPDFKAMEITALETAMDNKAYLKEGLLNAAIWYESELVSLNSQSVKAVFVDTYGLSDPNVGSCDFFKSTDRKMLRLRDWTAEEEGRRGMLVMPIFSQDHYVASVLTFTSSASDSSPGGVRRCVLHAQYQAADSLPSGYSPTKVKATTAAAVMKEKLADTVEWSNQFEYNKLQQQDDAAADTTGKYGLWSCGLHAVANCVSFVKHGRWSDSVEDGGLTYKQLRQKHWRITMLQAGKVCHLISGGVDERRLPEQEIQWVLARCQRLG